MSKARHALLLVPALVVAAGFLATPAPATDDGDVRAAAEALLTWLGGGSAVDPENLLPARGTVAVSLRGSPDADGGFGARQAAAVLREARRRWLGRPPAIEALDVRDGRWALVRGRLGGIDGAAPVDLLLSFRREDDRWVLREIREAAR